MKAFEVNVYNIIIDTVQQQLSERFVFNESLRRDIAWLDPKNFNQTKSIGILPAGVLDQIADLTNVNKAQLHRELRQFATHFDDYCPKMIEAATSSTVRHQEDDLSDQELL